MPFSGLAPLKLKKRVGFMYIEELFDTVFNMSMGRENRPWTKGLTRFCLALYSPRSSDPFYIVRQYIKWVTYLLNRRYPVFRIWKCIYSEDPNDLDIHPLAVGGPLSQLGDFNKME